MSSVENRASVPRVPRRRYGVDKKVFEIKTFDLDEIDVRAEQSQYPFDELEVGQGFTVEKPTNGISGTVSQWNKKSDRVFVTRKHRDSTVENPLTNVIRVK